MPLHTLYYTTGGVGLSREFPRKPHFSHFGQEPISIPNVALCKTEETHFGQTRREKQIPHAKSWKRCIIMCKTENYA